MVKKQKDAALVLSGGAARGLAHIGVIEELEAQDYNITSLAATSMGALIGAMYIAGTLPDFKEWILSLRKKDILRLLDPTFKSAGLIKGEKLFSHLEKFIPNRDISDFKIPFAIVVTDLTQKKELVFRSGNLRTILRAAISIPTIFTPSKINNNFCVDGGVSNNTPVNRVARKKGDVLIVSDVNVQTSVDKRFLRSIAPQTTTKSDSFLRFMRKSRSKRFNRLHNNLTSKFGVLATTLTYMIQNTSKHAIKETPADVYILVSSEIASLYDFFKSRLLIDYGCYETKKALKKYLK